VTWWELRVIPYAVTAPGAASVMQVGYSSNMRRPITEAQHVSANPGGTKDKDQALSEVMQESLFARARDLGTRVVSTVMENSSAKEENWSLKNEKVSP
jgi:hypothetical protein